MVDIDSFLLSLKAAWVTRLIKHSGKWSSLFTLVNSELNLPNGYIWKTNFRTKESFPFIECFPKFYQDVIIAFNMSKTIKPFEHLNKHEIFEQVIWGNEYFKLRGTCLYYGR